MRTEAITWHELPADGMPDADMACLLEIERIPGGDTEVWGGWWSGEAWIDDTSGDQIERHGDRRVIAWAEQPAGSRAC